MLSIKKEKVEIMSRDNNSVMQQTEIDSENSG